MTLSAQKLGRPRRQDQDRVHALSLLSTRATSRRQSDPRKAPKTSFTNQRDRILNQLKSTIGRGRLPRMILPLCRTSSAGVWRPRKRRGLAVNP